jgi:hypothetical protein
MPRQYIRGTPAERIWARLRRPNVPDACWEWQGARTAAGYGVLQLKERRLILVHRFIYEQVVERIPDGYDIDHLCRNPSCAYPHHLEAVTHQENARRGLRGSLVTHCPKGHAYNETNTYFWPLGSSRRRCRACAKDQHAIYYRTHLGIKAPVIGEEVRDIEP